MGRSRSSRKDSAIVIDEKKGLIFSSEDELFSHFEREITLLEREFFDLRTPTDIPEAEFTRYDKHLNTLLDDPDEVWIDQETIEGKDLYIYLRAFRIRNVENPLWHVAVVYLTEDVPSFVYLHFPTQDVELAEKYRRGEQAFSRAALNAPVGAIDGDALMEGDSLAKGLYEAMLKLRTKEDVPEVDFRDYQDLRETAIEEPDEIWRNTDSTGNVLVTFIKDFSADYSRDLIYVVVTIEDAPSNSHALLFSFPSNDKNLIVRYRHGENLQADEVVQESSH